MSDFIKKLAQATGLTEELAQAVIETATEYVKQQRPDKAAEVDALLENDATADRALTMITKMGKKAKRDLDVDE